MKRYSLHTFFVKLYRKGFFKEDTLILSFEPGISLSIKKQKLQEHWLLLFIIMCIVIIMLYILYVPKYYDKTNQY